MSQTKRQSMIESVTQNVVGYLVGLGTQYVVFPLFGMEANLTENLIIGAIFAIVSTARSYIVRRMFNKQHLPDTRNADLVQALHASNMQRGELILELQECNIELQVDNKDLTDLVVDMQEYIRKNDGFPY